MKRKPASVLGSMAVVRMLAVLLIAEAATSTALAQQNSEQRIDRTVQGIERDTQNQVDTALPLSQRALIDYGAYATYSYLSFDDAEHNNHGLNEPELVAYGRLNLDNANDLYVRARGFYLGYNPGDNPDGRPNHIDGVVEEGWYHFSLAGLAADEHHDPPPVNVDVKAGRQFVDWGIGLTLDQYADGILAQISSKPVTVDLLASVTIRQTIDFDISRPDLDESTERGFYGVKVGAAVGRANPYGYILFQRDYNRPESLYTHVLPTRYRYNSYYAGVGINGPIRDSLLYAVEGCFEGGRGLSNSFNPANSEPVTQTADPIEAYAGKARLDYLPGDVHRSRLSIEGIISSGDHDRINTSGTFGGNRPNTGDHAFNALGDSDTGLAFGTSVSNLMLLRLGASTYPFAEKGPFGQLQSGVDLFFFAKTQETAPIDEATLNSRYLGFEPDLFLNWRPTDDVTLVLRYGLFVPGDAIPEGQPNFVRQFFYAGVTYAL
jgi:hypothetical protein